MTDTVPVLRTDALSFDELYRADFARVVALVYALSGSRWAAEEIAQDAFAAAHHDWLRLSAYADPGGWVRAVAMNKARSAFRRRTAEARAMTRLRARPVRPAELPADADAFWRAVRALPRMQSLVVALRYADDRSIDDIAAVLDIASGTVKAHLHAARKRLAADFGDAMEER